MYAVLTGDLVNHQKYGNYEALAARLNLVLKLITKRYKLPLEQPFGIFRGDSFQALVPAAKAVSEAYTIRLALLGMTKREVDARIGIGVGRENTWSAQLATSRGQSFAYAAQALKWLEQHKGNRIFMIGGPDEVLMHDIRHIQQMLTLLDALSSQWTIAAIEAIRLTRNHPHRTQSQLAEGLKISQPGFAKRLQAAQWPVMHSAITHIDAILQQHSHPTGY